MLDVSDNYLGLDNAGNPSPAGLRALAAAVGRHPRLESLDLSRNGGFGE